MTSPIRQLPEFLINQIKAGEVVERPASLIKELVENSVDAGSSKIEVSLQENGIELISVVDDGSGMSMDSLPLAFRKHSTSKIEKFDDLYNLHSYGFRGEALASIASVGRITCTSTPRDNKTQGGKIVISGGIQDSLVPFNSDQPGTSIFVRDLFFNTPARLKFIKSKQSEKNALRRILNYFILTHPEIEFRIGLDQKEKEIYSKENELKNRVKKVVFKKREENKDLYEIEKGYEGHSVHIFLSKTCSRGNAGKNHYIFANGRLIEDKKIHQTIIHSLGHVWRHGENGHYVIYIEVPANKIDVNVHPNKVHIKFSKENLVYSLISASLKEIKPDQEFIESVEDTSSQNTFNMLAASPENSSSSYDPMPPGFDSRYAQTAAISETSTQTVSLSDDYLLSLNDEPLLFNKKNIIWDVIQSIMANSSQSSTPLLVGEPIHSKNSRVDQYFEFLSRRGIELNRISSDGLILKSIPTFLERAPYGNLVSYLVSLLEESSPEDLNLDKILSSELLSIFDNKSWDELVSIDNIRSSGVLIDQSKLERLYHEDR